MKSKRSELILEAVVWLVLSAIAFFATFKFAGPLPTYKLGAAFWPQIVLVVAVITAFISAVTAYFPPSSIENAFDDTQMPLKANAIGVFLVPLVYVYAMHKFGFFLVTPVFLPIYLLILGVRKIRTLVLTTVGLYTAIIFVFVYLIYTPLPQGAGYFHSLNGQFIGLFQ